VYNKLPILETAVIETRFPSQVSLIKRLTSYNSINLLLIIFKIFVLTYTTKFEFIGNVETIDEYSNIPAKKARIKPLLELLCNSEILTFINISIKRNNIDTAPIYTNMYDRPIKGRPIKNK
jgi:hypothetical protein